MKDDPKNFYHFTDNLYVLIVPKNREGAIENLFDPNTLKIEIAGKSFSRDKKIDSKTQYSKSVFAEKVISAKQKDINFDGFKEVFEGLREVMNDCRERIE